MIPFLAMHALAARRGDGLRPELVVLLERHETAPNVDLAVALSERLQVDETKQAAPSLIQCGCR